MREAVAGATVEIDTPLGTKVPVKYAADGSVTGEAGSVAFFLGSAADHGRWWVAREKLCHRWTTWFKGETTCLTVLLDGAKITWTRDDGDTGTATLLPKAPIIAARQISQQRSTLGGPIEAAPAPPAAVIAATPPDAEAPLPPRFVQASAVEGHTPLPLKSALAEQHDGAVANSKKIPLATKIKVATHKHPASQTISPASFWVHGIEDGDVLNIRAAPSSESGVVGEIEPQAHGVHVSGNCQDQWCPIEFKHQHGWVNRTYLVYEIPEIVADAQQ